MALSHGPLIVTNGLVLALDAADRNSYSGSGTTWTDLSGRGNTGTLTGAGYNSANGGSLTFDGTDDYVNFSFANPFAETVIIWARSATSTWNRDGWISSSRRENGHIIHPVNYLGPSKNVDYYVLDSSSSFQLITTVTPSDITVPHMYAYTTNGSNSHKGYFDGQLVGESTTSITRTTTPSSQVWYVGRDDSGSRYGNGSVYNVTRYNRALTAAEIQQNFNATRSRFGI
jgi:hypothetical protein